jgi:hypothetical protein
MNQNLLVGIGLGGVASGRELKSNERHGLVTSRLHAWDQLDPLTLCHCILCLDPMILTTVVFRTPSCPRRTNPRCSVVQEQECREQKNVGHCVRAVLGVRGF